MSVASWKRTHEFALDEFLLTEDDLRRVGDDVEHITLELLMRRLDAIHQENDQQRPCDPLR